MKKARALVEFFNKSTQASTELLKVQRNLDQYKGKVPVGLLQDVMTRWYSTWRMGGRLVRLKAALIWMSFNKNIDQELMLTDEQWQILAQITQCLKTMAKWQRLLEGDKFVTASLVVLAIHSICSNFKKTIADASTLLPVKKLTEKLLKDFDDQFVPEGPAGKVKYTGRADIGHRNRYNGVHPYYFIASLLDPRTKGMLPKLMSDDQFKLLKQDVIAFMVELKKEQFNDSNKTDNADETANVAAVYATEMDDDVFAELEELEENGSVHGEEIALPGAEEMKLACEYELKLFLQSTGLKLRKANKKEYNDPLPWWKENASKYPALAPLAQLFLCIPASSAPSERVWSQAARVLTVKRTNTTDEVSSGIMFVRENMELLRKHYNEVSKSFKNALPLEFTGLPTVFQDITMSNEVVDVGQDLFDGTIEVED
jgi:hypothetical protein